MSTEDGAKLAQERESADEDFASSLFTFLSAVAGVSTEEERARLIATGLSAVVPCAVAGVALVDESRAWTITWQMKGQPLEVSPDLIEQLEPLHQLATERPTLLIATREGGPAALGVPPVFEALRVRRLAVGSLTTSRHHLGVLFAGREAGRPFSSGEQLALLGIAQQAAVGIENLRLHEVLKGHSRSRAQQNVLSETQCQPQTADWPGDVRELMHVIERAVLTARDGRRRFDLPGRVERAVREREPATGEILTDAELQRAHDDNLRAALDQTGWKIYGPRGTAELLGMKPTTLAARVKKAGLRRPIADDRRAVPERPPFPDTSFRYPATTTSGQNGAAR